MTPAEYARARLRGLPVLHRPEGPVFVAIDDVLGRRTRCAATRDGRAWTYAGRAWVAVPPGVTADAVAAVALTADFDDDALGAPALIEAPDAYHFGEVGELIGGFAARVEAKTGLPLTAIPDVDHPAAAREGERVVVVIAKSVHGILFGMLDGGAVRSVTLLGASAARQRLFPAAPGATGALPAPLLAPAR